MASRSGHWNVKIQNSTVSDIGEDALVARLVALLGNPGSNVVAGPGDDCAVVDWDSDSDRVELLKTDCIVEGVHFSAGTDPILVGRKAICRTLSDLAAMGGTPRHALVTVAVDRDRQVSEIENWYRGMAAAAKEFGGFCIVGGETVSLPKSGAILSVAISGEAPRRQIALRNGATPGNEIMVTGRLGGSFASGRHLNFVPRLTEARWLLSQPRNLRPTAMMDLSDGLAKDLPRLAEAGGGLGYEIDLSAIPCHDDSDLGGALSDGEDYELLFTLKAGAKETLILEWEKQFGESCPLTCIGIVGEKGNERTDLAGGWDHFDSGEKRT